MYSGKRDPEVRIVVSKEHCDLYIAKTGTEWIEVFIPPESTDNYNDKWGSTMVKPEQVFFVPNQHLNIVQVNDFASIDVSVKDDSHHVITREMLNPSEIIGRYLKFWAYRNACDKQIPYQEQPSIEYYHYMMSKGWTMLHAIHQYYTT